MPGKADFFDLGADVADTHAHLDMLDDPVGALERAAMAHVAFVANIVDLTESPMAHLEAMPEWPAKARKRLEDWELDLRPPALAVVLGAHPHNARLFDEATEQLLVELASRPDVAAVGEIGLDYHYDHSPRETQRRVFTRQLELAHELGLAAVVHLREAHDEGVAVLRDLGAPAKGCVIHCFTEGPELAEEFLGLGCHISFAGPVTFEKADEIREAAKAVPLERLLVETDCPFLAPVPHRGSRNEPAYVTYSAAKIAEVRGIQPSEVASASLENAFAIFGKPAE